MITEHIQNFFAESGLVDARNVQILHIAKLDQPVTYSGLEVIILVKNEISFKRKITPGVAVFGDAGRDGFSEKRL